ncbi:unnamed protein product [Rotaria socialis]|uniref:Uncharacterized protein n=2 Tax=Rotaria socialis TaxID=392032 RepID=A0A817WCZ7_9BILA|nr:unnamed protein product [Rotaria socialis]CAF3353986.1 unnamed protein product [Rotaria socialis]CAF3375197.1 unnamed protein product [Rotaria socialis]CAF3395028.1 unnamed protein product [Rotaria socialis]CAF3473084.1 unnamed protein product [Rotaria socialis]
MSTNYVSFKTVKWCIMSSFLKDLPCRNPDSFTRLHSNGAIRQTSVRPTYTAAVDSNAKEIINDPVPMLIHRLSRLPKDESRKRPIPEDESQVPSFTIDQSKRAKQTSTDSSNQQQPNTHDYNEDIS